MKLRYLTGLAIFLSMGCTHAEKMPNKAFGVSPINTRLAQAQVASAEGSSVQGVLNFEQMPNSLIVTYSLQGMQPKENYQILLKEDPSCELRSHPASNSLFALRANKQGNSENTFKTEDFTVSGERALLGKTVMIVSSSPGKKKSVNHVVACGHVEARNPSGGSDGSSDDAE